MPAAAHSGLTVPCSSYTHTHVTWPGLYYALLLSLKVRTDKHLQSSYDMIHSLEMHLWAYLCTVLYLCCREVYYIKYLRTFAWIVPVITLLCGT